MLPISKRSFSRGSSHLISSEEQNQKIVIKDLQRFYDDKRLVIIYPAA